MEEGFLRYIVIILRPRLWFTIPFYSVCWIFLLVGSIALYRRGDRGWRWFLCFVLLLVPVLASLVLWQSVVGTLCRFTDIPSAFTIWAMAELLLFFAAVYCYLQWNRSRTGATIGRKVSLLSAAIAGIVCFLALICLFFCQSLIPSWVFSRIAMLIIITPFAFILIGEISHYVGRRKCNRKQESIDSQQA